MIHINWPPDYIAKVTPPDLSNAAVTYETFSVNDGLGGFEIFQVSDGAGGFENFEVRQ